MICRNRVDLPFPESSHYGEHLAATHLEVDSVEHATAAKRFEEILNPNLDTGGRHSSSILRLRLTQEQKLNFI